MFKKLQQNYEKKFDMIQKIRNYNILYEKIKCESINTM